MEILKLISKGVKTVPRKRRILKEHIMAAALELIKAEGFRNFTARRIAEYLNASTQPIYKEFENMDDLKDNLQEYVKESLQNDVFQVSNKSIELKDMCANYIRFAKEEATLFCALFLDNELSPRALHESALNSLNEAMNQMQELDDFEERKAFLNIIWPSIHGTAVLTAQGQFELDDCEINDKANHIVTHSLNAWKKSQVA